MTSKQDIAAALGLAPGQSLELLKALHIVTRDGAINQDSRRKLKQVRHLAQFLQQPITAALAQRGTVTVVDHGAGKSYFGFILYDWFLRGTTAQVFGVETRAELVSKAQALAASAGFSGMHFLHSTTADAVRSDALPEQVDIVTALHACNTATDEALDFALAKQAQTIALVPCCQAEVARTLNQQKQRLLAQPTTELWRHPLHTRDYGSHLTNVLRCLRLEAHGYHVTVTELVGWEHALKNELILAERRQQRSASAQRRLRHLLESHGLEELQARFAVPTGDPTHG